MASLRLPPFQTWDEIERQISHSGLSDSVEAILWDALYLRRTEIDELLKDVEERAGHPFRAYDGPDAPTVSPPLS